MIWLWLTLILAQAVLLVVVGRWVVEIRKSAAGWRYVAQTLTTYDVRIRYLHELVNPMARTGQRPWPRHLKENQ